MSAHLSKDTARTVRTYSKMSGIPLSAIVEDALRDFLARQTAIADLEQMLLESGTDLVEFVAAQILAEQGGAA